MSNPLVDSENYMISETLGTHFKPSSWLAKINFINHLVHFNNVLMAVVAEKGGGKSTFMSLLRTSLAADADIQSFAFTATHSFSSTELLNQVSDALQLKVTRDDAVSLSELVEQVNAGQSHVLLIIDDAQYLDEGFLKIILNALKKQDKKSFFHVCLLADLSLVGTLNQFQRTKLKDYIQTIEPGSLSEIETKTYIFSRLAAKGLEKRVTEERLEQFYHLTAGNIAKINGNLNSFFSPVEKTRFPRGRLGLVAAVVFTILVGSVYWMYAPHASDSLAARTVETKVPHSLVAPNVMTSAQPNSQNEPEEQSSRLVSIILPYYEASIHREVQPAPLRSIIEATDLDPDDFQENLVVMDKVVVIPNPKSVIQPIAKNDLLPSQLVPIHTE